MSTYYLSDGLHGNSILRNEADSADLASENTGLSDVAVGTKLCVVLQFYQSAVCNKTLASTGVRIEVRKDSGSWLTLSASDLAAYACSGLSDEGASANRCSDPSGGGCSSGFAAGKECTDGETTLGISAYNYSNVIFGIDTTGAANGSLYEFRGYDTTNSAAIPFSAGDAVGVSITMETLSGTEYYRDITGILSSSGDVERILDARRDIISNTLNMAGALERLAEFKRLIGGDLAESGDLKRKSVLHRLIQGIF